MLRQEIILKISTNKHPLLSNIELRTMSEGTNYDAELRIVEDEMELEERRKLGEHSLTESITTVVMTEVSPSKNRILEKGVLESEKPNQSPVGGFPSLSSGQSSEGEEENPVVSSTSKVKILQFEDTLSKENCRHFNIIYECLLLEGRAGNLTKPTLKVVLAQKPPT